MANRVGNKGRLGVFEASEVSTPTFAREHPNAPHPTSSTSERPLLDS